MPGGLTAWIILAVSFVADGASWVQSMGQARRQAKEYKLTVWRYILRSSDPVVRAVVFEDSAALIGAVNPSIGGVCTMRGFTLQLGAVPRAGL